MTAVSGGLKRGGGDKEGRIGEENGRKLTSSTKYYDTTVYTPCTETENSPYTSHRTIKHKRTSAQTHTHTDTHKQTNKKSKGREARLQTVHKSETSANDEPQTVKPSTCP